MNMRLIAGCSVLLIVVSLMVAGCTQDPQTYLFDESANGTTAEVEVGTEIILELEENPTTGYEWNVTVTGLEVVKDEYVPSDTSGQMVGSGGTHVWYMNANEAGTATISGIYKRSWEETTGNETTFDMTFIVR